MIVVRELETGKRLAKVPAPMRPSNHPIASTSRPASPACRTTGQRIPSNRAPPSPASSIRGSAQVRRTCSGQNTCVFQAPKPSHRTEDSNSYTRHSAPRVAQIQSNPAQTTRTSHCLLFWHHFPQPKNKKFCRVFANNRAQTYLTPTTHPRRPNMKI